MAIYINKMFVCDALTKCVIKTQFSCFWTKTYVEGTQKNRLNEMGLLSNQKMYYLKDKK